MDNIQEKSFQLLCEIDEICKNNDIKYFLSPGTARQAFLYEGFLTGNVTANIIMSPEDMNKFSDLIDEKERSVETLCSNIRFPEFAARYVNENSTYIQLQRGSDYKNRGISVGIIPLRNEPDRFKNKMTAFLENGWECNGFRFTKKLRPGNIISFATVRMMIIIIGRRRLSRWLYKLLSNSYVNKNGHKNENKVFIRSFKKKRKYFDKGLFENVGEITFEGREFPVPADIKEYFKEAFGTSWFIKSDNAVEKSEKIIQIANVPYNEFEKFADERGYNLNKLFKKQRNHLIDAVFVFRHFSNTKRVWDVAKRSGDRLRYYEEFSANREIIHNLYQNQKYEELDRLFAQHEADVRYYHNLGLGFCVCKEFFDIQCRLLELRGEKDFVDELRQMIPKKHLEPIKEI